jgi:PAS domain S-box-containing protein
MKPKITPTSKERKLKEDDFIVSKTDPTGRITYCNRVFMDIAGYREKELLGVQHNIIRHPDMPRAAFSLMWDIIKGGNEFFAYVKNMSKDGGFYWVFANVTPSYSPSGELVGYYSVRRRPSERAIAIVEPIYAEMLAAEQRVSANEAIAVSTQILLDKLEANRTDYERFVLSI